MINCNLNNRDFSLPKNIIETQGYINQIKLIHKPNSTKEILIVVDYSGEIIAITIDSIKDKNKMAKLNKYEIVKTHKYNSKIDFHDNSPWSVDCQYPYIIIGSNNRTIFVFNYEDENNIQDINNTNNNTILNNNSVIYIGNNHNIPYITISDDGAFIGNNSIDTNFKIFDFYTGDLICTGLNPNSEKGWGVKFIPKDLFKIKNFTFKDYEKRKEDNFSCLALQKCNMSDLNLNNPSSFDENNYNIIPYEELNIHEKYIKTNLIDKYYILSTCYHCAGLFKLDYIQDGNKKILKTIPLGKIELVRTYIRDLFVDKEQLDYRSLAMINEIKKYCRYEFVFYSKIMNLFLLGSKSGDLHVYEMNLCHDKTNKLICVEDEPNILISFGDIIVGMKFIENINENGRKIIDIFILTLSGIFYYYKIMPELKNTKININ